MVPIFLNGIPVPLANDAYPVAILTSFALHYYFPILREVAALSKIFKVSILSMNPSASGDQNMCRHQTLINVIDIIGLLGSSIRDYQGWCCCEVDIFSWCEDCCQLV